MCDRGRLVSTKADRLLFLKKGSASLPDITTRHIMAANDVEKVIAR